MYSGIQKYISGTLIFVLLFLETFQVSWFDRVGAEANDSYDVVSIIVDRNTYRTLGDAIRQYASDIQTYLPDTRTSIHIVDPSIDPARIAAMNERLYYEGDGGEGVSHLVGTILIGDVPLPMVSEGGKSFPSVFPYVDFVDKAFTYDEEKKTYTARETSDLGIGADIWHGVIDPELSSPMNATTENALRGFFEKTHRYYTKTGNFSLFDTQAPRVFYHDRERELAGLKSGDLYAYTLSMTHIEDIVYNRFSKYFAAYLTEAIDVYNATIDTDTDLRVFLEELGLTSIASTTGALMITPDVLTEEVIQATAKKFYEIVNTNSLGEMRSAVHNAGRYNSGTEVRVDTAPTGLTSIDTASALSLRHANEQLEQLIDREIMSYARRIALFDTKITTHTGTINPDTGEAIPPYKTEDRNYFYGQEASGVTDASMCTIARGSDHTGDYRDGLLVEANQGFDLKKIEGNATILASDTEALASAFRSQNRTCFPQNGDIRLWSYWGGNSGLNLATGALAFRRTPVYTGFSLPIFSLGGMNETTRMTPASPTDCTSLGSQYTLLQPFTKPAGAPSNTWNFLVGNTWPELGRFTCITAHQVGTSKRLSDEYDRYGTESCLVGTIRLDTTIIRQAYSPCIVMNPVDSGIPPTDTTTYEDQVYHRISSIVFHKSPTNDEYETAKKNGSTPSLAIDHDRYVEFLTPKGVLARITYPNFFRMRATTIEEFRSELRSYANAEWENIIRKEANAIDPDGNIAEFLITGTPLPTVPPDWNTYLTDDAINEILRIKKWIRANPYDKYDATIEGLLSLSHGSGSQGAGFLMPGVVPRSDTHRVYDMAYLSFGKFRPEEAPADIAARLTDIAIALANIGNANLTETGSESLYSNADSCGPVDGVELQKWFPAILCWLKNLLPPRISAGSCGGHTLGDNTDDTLESQSFSSAQEKDGRYDFLTGGTLHLLLPRSTFSFSDTIQLGVQYKKNEKLLDLTAEETVRLEVTKIVDRETGKTVYENENGGSGLNEYLRIPVSSFPIDHGSLTLPLVAGKRKADVTLRAHMGPFTPGDSSKVFEVFSEPLTLTLQDEYIALSLSQENIPTSLIRAGSGKVTLSITGKNGSGESLAPFPPYILSVYDESDGSTLLSGEIIQDGYIFPESLTERAGSYRMEVTDSLGRSGRIPFSILASEVRDITIIAPSNTLIRSMSLPIALSLEDLYGNRASGDVHTLRLRVTNGFILLPDGEKVTEKTYMTVDGYILAEVGSDTAGSMTLEVSGDEGLVSRSMSLRVIPSATIAFESTALPIAGGDPVTYTIFLRDSDGTLLSDISSVAFLSIPSDVGVFGSGIISIMSGESAPFSFTPGKQAGVFDTRLDVPGITDQNTAKITIVPGVSMSVTLKDMGSESGTILATLHDRYGNVTEDAFTGKYAYYGDDMTDFTFTNGRAILPRQGGYLQVHVPALENASFTIRDASGSLSIPAVADSIIYVREAQKSFSPQQDYNALYTIMPGGNYTREGAKILYETDPNRALSLGVTTLLSDPSANTSAVSISAGGNVSLGSSFDDVWYTPSILTRDGRIFLRVTNSMNHEIVGDMTPRFSRPNLRVCSLTGCLFDETESTILLTPLDTNLLAENEGDRLVLSESGNKAEIFSIDSTARITLKTGYELSFESEHTTPGLAFLIMYEGFSIARVVLLSDRLTPLIVSDNSLSSTSAGDTFVITPGPHSTARPIPSSVLGSPISDYELSDRSVSSSVTLLDTSRVGPNEKLGFEKIRDQGSIGWQGVNHAMLSFAAGDTLGESTKWQSTYLMINLGDPVAHLDTRAPSVVKNGLDRSIGHAIHGGEKGNSVMYRVIDTNNDGYDDIVILYDTGYVELFLNEKGRFRSRGFVAHFSDSDEKNFEVGDFTGDKYGDFLFVSDLGKLSLVDNTLGKLSRVPISVAGSSLPEGIIQLHVFDMDADGLSDIVYLTEAGKIGIFYGTATRGIFTDKEIENDLNIRLDSGEKKEGGALYYNGLPQLPEGYIDTTELDAGSGANEALIRKQAYFQRMIVRSNPNATSGQKNVIDQNVGTNEDGSPNTDLADAIFAGIRDLTGETITGSTASTLETRTYIRSEYAPAKNISISRTYASSGGILRAGIPVTVTIDITNNSLFTLPDIEYLDTVPSIFSTENTKNYTRTLGQSSTSEPLTFLDEEFGLLMKIPSLEAGETARLTYTLTTLPLSYGKMLVGKFESGEVGDDPYGDIAFDGKSTCGASILLWRSTALRDYAKGTRDFSQGEIPEALKQYFTDLDKNGIPDYIDTMTIEERKEKIDALNETANPSIFVDPVDFSNGKLTVTVGLSPEIESKVTSMLDDIQRGLSCGFGGGSCMSFPINWAPLAPGSTPSILGLPLGILSPTTGIPVFSSITGIPLYGPWGCIPIPTVWPVSPIGFSNTCGANLPSAGGYLGTWDPTNTVRIYITPTLTLGMGEAICLGGPANVVGNQPPQGVSPLVPGGNCIVIAHPMPFCKEDGSEEDGDVKGMTGLGSLYSSWNARSCSIQANLNNSGALSETLRNEIIDYIRNPSQEKLNSVHSSIAQRGSSSLSVGPLVKIGSGDGAIGIDVTVDSRKGFSFQDIVKIRNKSVSAFPDFLMDWVDRQVEEIVNKFLTLPTLTIVLPQASQNWSIVDYTKGWDSITRTWNSTKQKSAFENTTLFSRFGIGANSSSSLSSISTSIAGGTNAIRAAYEFIGKLPLVDIQTVKIPINIPWITPEDLDKTLMQWELQLSDYERSFDSALAEWCVTPDSLQCVNAKLNLDSSKFLGDLRYNIAMLESYKKFPEKLMKLFTWKQRLIDQITCNIDAIEQMVGGWLRDNSRRFRAWVEAIVLIKAILKSWQPILDLFADYQRNCTVCRNERYDLKYFQFKIISAIIPDLPVIRFPKWPDIILDLHDIRAGIRVSLPEFIIQPVPIRLPRLPTLSFPSSPGATFILPSIPRLPALPEIPELPELPSLPTVTLPNLPPPPKLPKLFGSIAGVLDILKIVEKVLCLMRKELWVPEWRVGDVIAQRTSRQGLLSLDFLNIQFPEFSYSFLKEIEVATHVNLEFRIDFLTEMARSIVAPINEFSSDLTRGIPQKIVPDVRIESPLESEYHPKNIPSSREEDNPQHPLSTEGRITHALTRKVRGVIALLEHDARTTVSIEEMKGLIRQSLFTQSGAYTPDSRKELLAALSESDFGTERITREMQKVNEDKFTHIRSFLKNEKKDLELMEQILKGVGKEDTRALVQLYNAGNRYETESISGKGPNSIFSQAYAHDPSPLTTSYRESSEILRENIEKNMRATLQSIEIDTSHLTKNGNRRLAYETETLSELSTMIDTLPANTTSTPTPNYEGIYVLDDTKKQTRLFDWTEELGGKEEVILSDVDRDGDEDFIYQIGNTLFVKIRHTIDAPVTHTLASSEREEGNTGEMPHAVDALHEVSIDPNSVNLSWSPARPDDRIFRIVFSDRMFDFDDEQRGNGANIHTSIVDAVVTESTGSNDRGFQSHPLTQSVSSTRGDITVSHPGVRAVREGDVFALSSGRSLYTAQEGVEIDVEPSGQASFTLFLEPFTQYLFEEPVDIRIMRGRLYVADPNARSIDPIDFIGMPILPDLILTPALTGASVEITSHVSQTNFTLGVGEQYSVIDLGNFASTYYAHFEVPNGWYYGKVTTLGTPGVRAGVVLLSPEQEGDREGSIIDIPDTINIPVYVPYTLPLDSVVSDRSSISLQWDTDTKSDTNGDGDMENDFVSNELGVVSRIGSNIVFGPFTSLLEKHMALRVTDGNGNIRDRKFTLSVFAPIPKIESIERTRVLSGSIDIPVALEPIDIMRYRNGSFRILSSLSTITDERGRFFVSLSQGEGEQNDFILRSQSGAIARIDRENGTITILDPNLRIQVEAASFDTPMTIRIIDALENTLYSQTLSLPPSTSFVTSGSGILISTDPGYTFVTNTLLSPTLPGGGFITDADARAVAGIAQDGNIYILDKAVSLAYGAGAVPSIEILKDGNRIAKVTYTGIGHYMTQGTRR